MSLVVRSRTKDTRNEIIDLIESPKKISKAKILNWMADGDLGVRGAVYTLTDKVWNYIHPELNIQEQCSFMRRYLIECLEKNAKSKNNDFIHSGFEAAWEIAAWMKHLRSIKDTSTILSEIDADLGHLYHEANEETRNRIITGALEHIFEDAELVPLFDKWQNHPELRVAYDAPLEWGVAHRNNI